jgi:hypothetical protein
MIKFKAMFQNEKLKVLSKKVFTKKKIGAAIVAVALIIGLKIGYSLMYEVNGTVLKVDTNSITVTNFLGTKTVNTGNYPIDSNRIIVGEKIEISKNLSGDVISIRTDGGNQGRDSNGPGGKFVQSSPKGQGRHNDSVPNGQGQNDVQGQNGQTQNGQGNQNANSGQGAVDGTSSASVGK